MSYRTTAVLALGATIEPLSDLRAVEDPYELPTDAGAVVPLEPCVHGAPPGTSCIYCRNAAALARVPSSIEHAGERELAELLRRLIAECRATWKGSAKAKWKGQFDRYQAWYLARRLINAGGITVDVEG